MKKLFSILIAWALSAAALAGSSVSVPSPEVLRAQLAADAGAGRIGYKRDEAGAIARTLKKKADDVVSVADFGAKCDGASIDTAAFQAAVATGKRVRVPKGTAACMLDAAINVAVDGTQIEGDGITASQVYQTVASAKIFNVTANDVAISGLSLDYSGTPVAGAVAIYAAGANSEYHSLKINHAYVGIEFTGAHIQSAHHFKIYSTVLAGVWVHAAGDVYIDSFLIDAVNATNSSQGNIRLTDYVEAFVASNGDVLNGVRSLVADAAVNAAGSRPAYNAFTNVYFDGGAQSVYLNNIVETVFTNAWFSGGRSGAGYPGVDIRTTDAISFVNSRFVNNGAAGAYVSANADRTSFIASHFLGNSATAGAGVKAGLYFEASAKNFAVVGCVARNVLFGGSQSYGIYIESGAVDFVVASNLVKGNASGGIFTSAAAGRIVDNVGYNPVGGSAITVGASPYTYTAGASPETVYISGGAVSSIVTQAAAVFSSTDKTVQLGPGESVQVTYSSAPYMNKVIH